MKIENSFGEVLLIVQFMDLILSAMVPSFFTYGFRFDSLYTTLLNAFRSIANNKYGLLQTCQRQLTFSHLQLFAIKDKRKQSYSFFNFRLQSIMGKSKSCEDIRINFRSPKASTDINSNVLISNLLKLKPCVKQFNSRQPSAYQIPLNIDSCFKETQFQRPLIKTYKGKLRRTYSQAEYEILINFQDQLRTKALKTLCNTTPIKSRTNFRTTVKELAKLNIETLAGSMKRGPMARVVMVNSKGTQTKQNHKKVNISKYSSQSSKTLQSITNGTFELSKFSFDEQRKQRQALILEKVKQFDKLLSNANYNQVLKTQRRKQSWKAFSDAERDRIRMLKNQEARNAYIKLNNDLRKANRNVKNKIKSCQDQQPFIQTMNFYKKFGKDFDFLSENYKLGQK